MRILLVSDLHLDTAFGWAGPALGDVLRANLRATLDRIGTLARHSRVDAVVCGGDLFDQARVTPDTLAHLRTTFAELDSPVHLAPGDDDWCGPSSPYRQVDWTPNVHVFTDPELTPVTLEDGLTLWGGAHDSPASTGGFLDGFHVKRDGVNFALFHGCETGTTAAAVPYAPFRAEQVEAAGLDHALLGHVTRPSTTAGSPTPAIPARSRPARPDRAGPSSSPSPPTARWNGPATTWRAAGCTRSPSTSPAPSGRPRYASGWRPRSPTSPAWSGSR